uniref:Zinc transporter ZIP14 n=2 Tax=Macrostomum lignano TaxID=282301 RepID=A0A1I8GRW6_9PLAT
MEYEDSQQFAEIFGYNGTLNSSVVADFLSSLRMDSNFAHQLKSQGRCPSHNFSSEVWYDGGRRQADLMKAIWETVQTPACYAREGGLAASLTGSTLRDTDAAVESTGGNTSVQVWGYGLLCVTAINLCSLLGVAFMPVMKRSFYRLLLTFMTALAVGSLIATALLILLPDSFELAFIHEETNSAHSVISRFASTKAEREGWSQFLSARPWYLWRCCFAFGGIYLFYVLERLLKELLRLRSNGSGLQHVHTHGVETEQEQELNKSINNNIEMRTQAEPEIEAGLSGRRTVDDAVPTGRAAKLRARLASVQPVAWMILLGDSLHNFIDGISLGAAFARSPLTGVSIGLAVLCEELPHELGDFAILLSAGMSIPMAAVSNLLSACVCYVGFAIGVLLGEVGFSVWIFAAGGGMFLYISLVDMMPEVNSAMDTAKSFGLNRWKIFLLQNIGLLLGYGLILLIAVFGGEINIE